MRGEDYGCSETARWRAIASLQRRFQTLRGFGYAAAFGFAEALERFGHDVAAQAEAGEGAFQTLDDAGGSLTSFIDEAAHLHHLAMQFDGAWQIARGGGLAERDVELRKQIRPRADAAMRAGQHGLGEQLFGADEQAGMRKVREQRPDFLEIAHVAGAVLQPRDARNRHGLPNRFRRENRRPIRHVVEVERKRQLRREALQIAEQFGLRGGEIVWRREHERVGSAPAGRFGDGERLGDRRFADAHQHRHPPGDDAANPLHKLVLERRAEARSLAGGAQNENAVHAATDHVLRQALQRSLIERRAIDKRGDERRNDAPQRRSRNFTCVVHNVLFYCFHDERRISRRTECAGSDEVKPLLIRQQKIAIAAAERCWAKAPIYFVLSTYPGLKSRAISLRQSRNKRFWTAHPEKGRIRVFTRVTYINIYLIFTKLKTANAESSTNTATLLLCAIEGAKR